MPLINLNLHISCFAKNRINFAFSNEIGIFHDLVEHLRQIVGTCSKPVRCTVGHTATRRAAAKGSKLGFSAVSNQKFVMRTCLLLFLSMLSVLPAAAADRAQGTAVVSREAFLARANELTFDSFDDMATALYPN